MSDSKFKDPHKNSLKTSADEASTVRKVVATVITTLIVIIAVTGISGFFYIKSALEPVDPDDNSQIKVKIPLGSSTSQIAGILEENGIIKNDLVFRLYKKFKNETGFQAGNYQFTQSMTIDEIIESLKNGKLIKEPAFKVTIPEGQTLEEIAQTYADQLEFSKEEFMKKVNDKEYVSQLIQQHPDLLTKEIQNPDIRYPLEGYLFAATYPFYVEDPTIEQIVDKMLKKTESVVLPYADEFKKRGKTIHEGITMASLLENEARTGKSRKKIAGVFYNRLEAGMPLQTDPTVLYAHGEHKERVLYKDLEIESPYNTYHVKTLPVGPISNFNKNSLQAAANPVKHEFLYFLADSNGKIHYSKSLEKHNELKDKYISEG